MRKKSQKVSRKRPLFFILDVFTRKFLFNYVFLMNIRRCDLYLGNSLSDEGLSRTEAVGISSSTSLPTEVIPEETATSNVTTKQGSVTTALPSTTQTDSTQQEDTSTSTSTASSSTEATITQYTIFKIDHETEPTTTGATGTSTPEAESPTSTENPSTTEEDLGFINILGTDNEETTPANAPDHLDTTSPPQSATMDPQTRKERLSDQIRAVIKHYKEYGQVTVPDARVPDPMAIPDIRKRFSGSDMTFTNTKVYGMSNFTIEHINTDLDKMQVMYLY